MRYRHEPITIITILVFNKNQKYFSKQMALLLLNTKKPLTKEAFMNASSFNNNKNMSF